MERGVTKEPSFQTASSNWSRVKMRPRCRARYSSNRNSRTVVTTVTPCTRTVIEAISISKSPNRMISREPAEKVDTKILETLVELDPGAQLPDGLRVDAFIVPDGGEVASAQASEPR